MKIGDKFNAILVLDQIDRGSGEWPFGFKMLGSETEYLWLSEKDIKGIQEEANPELKKARIQREIEALQKQLEELE